MKEIPISVTPERVELANCMSKAVSIAEPKRSEDDVFRVSALIRNVFRVTALVVPVVPEVLQFR